MGNPEILNLEPTSPAGEPFEAPPDRTVLWTVYRLRDGGKKLSPAQVARTGRTGLFSLWKDVRPPHALSARITDPSGYPVLDNLSNARVMRAEPGSGMLLYGTVLSVTHGQVSDMPQAWWCVVHSVGPVDVGPGQATMISSQ